jgi:hypothetical protein
MYKISLLAIAIILFSGNSEAQKLIVTINYVDKSDNRDNLVFKPGKSINWSDFQATPVMTSEAAAITNAGFGLNLSFKEKKNTVELVIDVNCSFSKRRSWVKEMYKNDYILNHERRHFDIAFIHSALFMQRLRQAAFTRENYVSLVEKIYRESAEKMSRFQNEYDAETSHSRIPEKQAAWDQKIASLLDKVIRAEEAYAVNP